MTSTGGRLLGYRVKQRRKELKLTQKKLGEKLGVDDKQIIRYEKDKYDTSTATIYDLSIALETTPNFLMGFTDDPEPPVSELSKRETRVVNQMRKKQYSAIVDELINEATENKPHDPAPTKPKGALDG